MVRRVKGSNGSEIPYGPFVDELLRGKYLTRDELQLFLELCVSRRVVQNKAYIESLCRRIADAKEKSLSIKGHKTLALTPFGQRRRESAHSRARAEAWKKRRSDSSAPDSSAPLDDPIGDQVKDQVKDQVGDGILELLDKAIKETRNLPLRGPLRADLQGKEETRPVLVEEETRPVLVEEEGEMLLYSACGGEGCCTCLCHQLHVLCLECRKMQAEAKAFLETSPSERERKLRLAAVKRKRAQGFKSAGLKKEKAKKSKPKRRN